MAITTFTPPSAEQILQQLLSNYSAIATSNGFNVGVNPGSEIYTRFSAVAQQQAIFYQIMLQQIDARMPDTATGNDLDRVLNTYGLVRKPATSAQGFIQLIGAAPQTLTAGMLLNGPNGLQYQVSTSGVYQPASLAVANTNTINTSYVPVSSVNQGSNTDLGIGQVLTWININSLMQSTAPVVVSLDGGSDAETDEQARFRLFQTLQNPPNAGNAQFLINLASNIDPIVEAGFVYSDYNGAGTQLIALMGYQSDGYYIGRDIPHLLTDNNPGNPPVALTSPYGSYSNPGITYTATNQGNYGSNLVNDTNMILGQLPAIVANQYATVVTTVNNITSNVIFNMQLPYPVGNPINGLGGGWINSNTWPVLNSPLSANAYVTAVASPTNITVLSYSTTNGYDSVYDPVPGVTAINWVDRSGAGNNGWRIVQSIVTSQISKSLVTTGIYAYNITLSIPLVCGITALGQTDFYGNTQVALNDYIFPASVNAQNYLNTVMNSYAQLGPGQVTNSTTLKQLGASRQPTISSIYSPIVGSNFLQALTTNNSEIYQVAFVVNNTISTGPAASNPPSIYIPQNIAFYDFLRTI